MQSLDTNNRLKFQVMANAKFSEIKDNRLKGTDISYTTVRCLIEILFLKKVFHFIYRNAKLIGGSKYKQVIIPKEKLFYYLNEMIKVKHDMIRPSSSIKKDTKTLYVDNFG
jgi:hypothetical protein